MINSAETMLAGRLDHVESRGLQFRGRWMDMAHRERLLRCVWVSKCLVGAQVICDVASVTRGGR